MSRTAYSDPRRAAVAVSYDTGELAPRVVAKGYGKLADTIVRVARENGLYVHESSELVGLLMQVDLDSHIPPQLYLAVAELLAWLYRLESRSAPGQAPKTGLPVAGALGAGLKPGGATS